MILSIDDRLELNIDCITQLCGINVQMKNYIIQNEKKKKKEKIKNKKKKK